MVRPPLVRPGGWWLVVGGLRGGMQGGDGIDPGLWGFCGSWQGLPDERLVRQGGAGRDGIDERVCVMNEKRQRPPSIRDMCVHAHPFLPPPITPTPHALTPGNVCAVPDDACRHLEAHGMEVREVDHPRQVRRLCCWRGRGRGRGRRDGDGDGGRGEVPEVRVGEEGGREEGRGLGREAVDELHQVAEGVVEGAEEHPAGALLRHQDVERGRRHALAPRAVRLHRHLLVVAAPPAGPRGREEEAPPHSRHVGALGGLGWDVWSWLDCVGMCNVCVRVT